MRANNDRVPYSRPWLQAPLILTIYVLLSFKAFHALMPGTSHPPPDDSFFAVPSHYKRRRLEDALDKAAMGMMRSSGRGDGDGAGEAGLVSVLVRI